MRSHRTLGAVGALLLAAGCSFPQFATEGSPGGDPHGAFSVQPRNPVLRGADPHVAVIGGRYWMYPTTPDEPGDDEGGHLHAYASDDLRRWVRTPTLISLADISWVGDDGAEEHFLWAPAMVQANGRYHLFYSVGPQNPTPSRIGVAVGDSPAGPFKDTGRPLLTGGDGFEAIDPMVFVDPKTGVPYLYAGGSAGSTLRVFELKPSLTEIEREIPVEQPPNFTEGAWMHERNGVYYLSYSHGRWNRADYSAHYATAPSPVGPWTYRGVLLESDAVRKGPGHNAFVRNPGTGEWFIVYHRWENRRGSGPFRGERQVAIQRVTYRPDGLIPPVRMDDAPPPSSPIRRWSSRWIAGRYAGAGADGTASASRD